MFRKIAAAFITGALVLSAVPAVAFADTTDSAVAMMQTGTSKTQVWDGKSTMKSGTDYVLKKSVTISKKVTIPEKTTLTINKGVKLGIAAKGSLYVSGKLAVKQGATVSVSGKLYTYYGSTVSDSGSIKLNSGKATVSVGGNFTINKTGSVSGSPKSVSVKRGAKISGKNSCAKLKSAASKTSKTVASDKKAVAKVLQNALTKMYVEGDYYASICAIYPDKVIEDQEAEFEELKKQAKEEGEEGEFLEMTYKDFINTFYGALLGSLFDEIGTIKSVKVTVTKIVDDPDGLNDEEKEMLKDCGKITDICIATVEPKFEIDFKPGTDFDESDITQAQDIKVVKIGGKWYCVSSAM